MEDKNLKERIKDHWTKHKTKYFLVGGGFLLLGVGILIGRKGLPLTITVGDTKGHSNVIVSPKAETIFVTQVATKGHPGNIIEDVSTGIKYLSQADAINGLDIGRHKFRSMIASGELINHGPNTGLKVA